MTPEKQALAWWLRTRTAVSCRWISERLGMGDESSVSRVAGIVRESGERRGAAVEESVEPGAGPGG